MVFLLGIIIISVFLFIPQPIKAETEIVGINSIDDVIMTCFWDNDGFFIGGGTQYNPYSDWLEIGSAGSSEVQEKQVYLKFADIPIIPNKNITSMRLRMYRDRSIEHGDDLNQTIFFNLINNNWNQDNN